MKNNNKITYADNGVSYFFISHYLDWSGEPIERTPDEFRYSYDPYVICKIHQEYKDAIYSDRILQQDYYKHNEICQTIFGNESQYWDNRSPKDVEQFLRMFFNDESIILCGIMQGCNVSSGYPYWIFMVKR